MNNGVLVLNLQRQIVFTNQMFAEFAGLSRKEEALGLRPGEAMGCYHALETAGGCGTSDYCRACGALVAILMAQKGKASTQECRIARSNDDQFEALDLRVTATPLAVGQEKLTVFSVINIADEKRRQILEHIFFHDLRNTASIIKGVSELISIKLDNEPFCEMLELASHRLLDEIEAQEQLLAAEHGRLELNIGAISTVNFMTNLISLYETQAGNQNSDIQLHPVAEEFILETDSAVLGRVVGNMIKNALEACATGETVTVGCQQERGEARFWVHNPTYMPIHVQRQVFKRSFSTKGAKRGLGTYSMRLLSERYLKGKVEFATHKTEGTTFTAICPIGNIAEPFIN